MVLGGDVASDEGQVLQEVVFSFDTTSSMSGCIAEVKGRLQDMMQRLLADIPSLKTAVFAHGDYCDRDIYITRHIDFTASVADLCQFVDNTKNTSGGDFPECYELVLREVRTELSWTPGSQRSLVVIGDAVPHEKDDSQNTQHIDWKEEVQCLRDMGVKIYSVQCNSNAASTKFFEHMAKETGGKHISLQQFTNVFDFLMAICYRERGADFLQTYEKEVRARFGEGHIGKDLEGMFGSLRPADAVDDDTSDKAPKTTAVPKAESSKISSRKRPRTVSPRPTKRMRMSPEKVEYAERESVPVAKFAFRGLRWSGWSLALVPQIPRSTLLWWTGRGEDKPGYRRDTLFRGDLTSPAVYEVAVQPHDGGKRFVVYTKFLTGDRSFASWERAILGDTDIQSQINNILESGCPVYIRRAVCEKSVVRSTGHRLANSYDYAWRRIRRGRVSHRDVVWSSILISSSSL